MRAVANHTKMRKILTSILICVAFASAGCSSKDKPKEEYRSSVLADLPFVYKMTVQQGNIVTEEMVDRLEPGMTTRQVRYLLGTPLLADMFHADRWDYTYTIRRGHQPMEIKRLTLYFSEDALVRVDGNLQPNPARAAERQPDAIIVSVPDWEDKRGIFRRTLDKLDGSEPDRSPTQ